MVPGRLSKATLPLPAMAAKAVWARALARAARAASHPMVLAVPAEPVDPKEERAVPVGMERVPIQLAAQGGPGD